MNRVRQLLPWSLVLLLLGWTSYGTWPLVPVEGDDQGVIFGVESMLHPEDAFLRNARYLYEVQPGSYHLLAALVKITGASVETVFGVTTIAGALAFALAGAWLLQALFAWPLAWLLVALLWCQEVTAAVSYANTSALAGGLAILAAGLAHRPGRAGWLGAGLALALAGWLRTDSLLVAPACLGLAYWRDRQWRPAIARTAAIAATATAGVLLLYRLSGTSLLAGAGSYAKRGYLLSSWRVLLESPVQLLSPALAMGAGAGLLLLMARRQYALALVVLSGVSASVGFYGASLTTPKYFYYLVPFALIPAVYLIDALRPWRQRRPRVAVGVLGAVFFCDGLLGLRTLEPPQRYFTTTPTWAVLGPLAVADKHFALVVGPGELIINADAFRLRTGQFFAPACWHREKMRVQEDLATMRSWLGENRRELTIYWANWLPVQLAQRELWAGGFHPAEPHPAGKNPAPMEDWHREGRTVHLGYLGYIGSVYQPPGPAPASTTGTDTYFIGDQANQPITELRDHRHWHLLSAVPEGLITLHRRQ